MHVSRDFYATMDSQMSVFCDDALELISDSDKYWWLVRDPHSGQSGYIPSEIVMTPHEHEARLNRNKNQELTRLRSSDLERASPWRSSQAHWQEPSSPAGDIRNSFPGGAPDSSAQTAEIGDQQEQQQLWSRSGFARRSTTPLRSAPAVSRHKKTVSFSERKPVEHHFAVEDSASSTNSEEGELLARRTAGLTVGGDDCDEHENGHGADDGASQEPLSPSPVGFYAQNVDPIVEELLEKEFGKPELGSPGAGGLECASPMGLPPLAPVPQANRMAATTGSARHCTPPPKFTPPPPEVDTFDDMREIIAAGEGVQGRGLGKIGTIITSSVVKRPASKLKKCIGKLWKAQEARRSVSRPRPVPPQKGQLLKIYAGNFSSVQGYKTILVEEEATMAEVADKSVEKFGLNGDRFNYMLSVVHYESHEILQVSAAHTLGMVIELAKRATLMEGDFAPQTDASMSRLGRRTRKQQTRIMRMCKSAVGHPGPHGASRATGFSCIASPVMQVLGEADLERDPKSDFVTHYKFVLNRWLDGPTPNAPFYLRVQMQLGHSGRPSSGAAGSTAAAGGVLNDGLGSHPARSPSPGMALASSGGKTLRSPLAPSSASLPAGLQGLMDDAKAQGNAKMLVNTSMSVAELCRAALASLEISAQVPGVKYDLFLSSGGAGSATAGPHAGGKGAGPRDRIYLSKDMTVQDILHLRPLVDPSGLVIVLQPVVDTYGKPLATQRS